MTAAYARGSLSCPAARQERSLGELAYSALLGRALGTRRTVRRRSGLVGEETSEDVQSQFDAFPIVDFSLHLLIPDDLDRLYRSLHAYNPSIPLIFRDLLQELETQGP